MKYEINSYNLTIPLTARQFDNLVRRDDRDYTKVHGPLEEAGAERIEFNGHFGRNIFFTVEKLESVPAIVTVLKRLCR